MKELKLLLPWQVLLKEREETCFAPCSATLRVVEGFRIEQGCSVATGVRVDKGNAAQ